jgi:peptidyl-prolyl cis-trans isomerase A (cyclophilin A)
VGDVARRVARVGEHGLGDRQGVVDQALARCLDARGDLLDELGGLVGEALPGGSLGVHGVLSLVSGPEGRASCAQPCIDHAPHAGAAKLASAPGPETGGLGRHDRIEPDTNPEGTPMADLKATLHTNRGDIVLDLFPNHAPATVENFVGLAEGTKDYQADGGKTGRFYDGLGFHRVIEGFMIQGGCPLGTGTGGPGYTFKDEFHPELAFTKPYLLAMANAGPGTNGSQFFITVQPTSWLTNKHTIFGEVADQESRDIVDAIASTATGAGDRPVEPVVIESVEIVRA